MSKNNNELPYKRQPLLTAKEEIELARLIKIGAMDDATILQKKRGERAKNRMINGNMRLVMVVAHKIWRTHKCQSMTVDDLVQEGAFGLRRAAELFDPARGYKFSTYAYGWINQALRRAVAQQDREIRLPLHVHDATYKFRRTREIHGATKTIEEVIEISGVNRGYLTSAAVSDGLISYNSKYQFSDSSQNELIDLLSSTDDPTYMDEVGWNLDDINRKLLPVLNETEQKVIIMNYGLNGHKKLALTAIAQELKISRDSITQTRNRAMNKLRMLAWHTPVA